MIWIIVVIIIAFILYENGIIQGMIKELKYPFSNDPEGKYSKPYHQRMAKIQSRKIILFFISLFIFFVFL